MFFAITAITFVVTFLLNPVSKKAGKMIQGNRRPKFHIHHSVTGLFICAIGLIIGSKLITGVGLGIYLGHVAEEIYFNKRNVIRSFFILITR